MAKIAEDIGIGSDVKLLEENQKLKDALPDNVFEVLQKRGAGLMDQQPLQV